MCTICMQYPCHPSCPNAEEPEAAGQCVECKRIIYRGEQALSLGLGSLCIDCLEEKSVMEVVRLLDGKIARL